jgi:polyferredoxin
MVAALALRGDTELHVLRDRAPLFVTLSDGSIRNGYTIKILNKARADRDYVLTVDGLPGAALTVVGAATQAPAARVSLVARPDSVATYRVYVAAPKAAQDSLAIAFRLSGVARGAAASQASSFVSPKR